MKVLLSILLVLLNTFSGYTKSPQNIYNVTTKSFGSSAVKNSLTATLEPRAGSTTVINNNEMLIYGLAAGMSETNFIQNYVQVNGDGILVIEKLNNVFATGTKVKLCDGTTNEVLQTYEIVIFGDVNCDGNIDSIDAGKTVDFENYKITWDPVTDKALYKAGDLNGDGNIDSIDAGIMVDSENYVYSIDQITGRKQAATSFNVIFKDYNGSIISSNSVEMGKDAPLPANPIRSGYVFAGWNGSYRNVSQNVNITALYIPATSNNIFKISSNTGNTGDTISLMVTLSGTVKTAGFTLKMKYDSSILELVSVDADWDLDILAWPVPGTNRIDISFSSSKNITVTKRVVEVDFKVLNTNATDTVVSLSTDDIAGSPVVFLDPNNNNVPTSVAYNLADGVVYINR